MVLLIFDLIFCFYVYLAWLLFLLAFFKNAFVILVWILNNVLVPLRPLSLLHKLDLPRENSSSNFLLKNTCFRINLRWLNHEKFEKYLFLSDFLLRCDFTFKNYGVKRHRDFLLSFHRLIHLSFSSVWVFWMEVFTSINSWIDTINLVCK